MPPGIVGTEKTYDFTVDKKDLADFMHMECLDLVVLEAAIL